MVSLSLWKIIRKPRWWSFFFFKKYLTTFSRSLWGPHNIIWWISKLRENKFNHILLPGEMLCENRESNELSYGFLNLVFIFPLMSLRHISHRSTAFWNLVGLSQADENVVPPNKQVSWNSNFMWNIFTRNSENRQNSQHSILQHSPRLQIKNVSKFRYEQITKHLVMYI